MRQFFVCLWGRTIFGGKYGSKIVVLERLGKEITIFA